MNNVNLIGRLTRDQELSYISSGTPLGKMSLAVDKVYNKNGQKVKEANFFDLVFWGKAAEALNQYLKKGKKLGITGELRQERWEQDGKKRSKVTIVVNSVDFIDSKGQGNPSQESQNNQEPFEDDIPF